MAGKAYLGTSEWLHRAVVQVWMQDFPAQILPAVVVALQVLAIAPPPTTLAQAVQFTIETPETPALNLAP